MAWTTPKTWSAGETLTAANFNTHIRDNLNAVEHLLVRKTSDEFVDSGTTGTTLQNDDQLVFALAATETWLFRWVIIHSGEGSGVPNIKIAFTVPAGTTMRMSNFGFNNSGTATESRWSVSGTSQSLLSPTSTAPEVTVITGSVATSGTSGNIQLQWAQNTSSTENETVYANSCLFGLKLA